MEKFRYAQLLTVEGNDYDVSLKVDEIEKIEINKKPTTGVPYYDVIVYSKIGFFKSEINKYDFYKTLEIINSLGLKIGEFER